MIECVPNFSDGRNREVIEAVRAAAESVAGVRVLDLQSDPAHHRSVLTFAGEPEPVAEAASRVAREAVRRIDLNRHQGEHPRMGAVDVIPFVPLDGHTMDDAIRLAREVGARIGIELQVPVFLYERAATRPERVNLAEIRKPQFEGMREIADLAPDFGPPRVHPTAGAVAVGARPPLIAYNIDLETKDVKVARRIAKAIRERDGGLPGIKALGLWIEERGCAQVSINVCDHTKTGLRTVFDRVRHLAAEAGVEVRSSEIVGLVPRAALGAGDVEHLRLAGFRPQQIIENALA
jgi:glutamate formiminotransferase